MTSEVEFLEQRRSAAMLARLAELLQQAMSWRIGARIAPQCTIESADREADCSERARDALPWWAVHHPAVSFRNPHPEEDRD